MAIETINARCTVGDMANGAINVPKMGLVGIAVREFLGNRFFYQYVERPMASETAFIAHRITNFRQNQAVAPAAGNPPLAVKRVHIGRIGPGGRSGRQPFDGRCGRRPQRFSGSREPETLFSNGGMAIHAPRSICLTRVSTVYKSGIGSFFSLVGSVEGMAIGTRHAFRRSGIGMVGRYQRVRIGMTSNT